MTRDEAKAAARVAGYYGDRDAPSHIYRQCDLPEDAKKSGWVDINLWWLEGRHAKRAAKYCRCEACLQTLSAASS